MAEASRVSRNLVIAVVLLVVLSAVFTTWTVFTRTSQQVAGKVIAPIVRHGQLIEVSDLMPGVELRTPVTDQVLSGSFTVKLNVIPQDNVPRRLQVALVDAANTAHMLYDLPMAPFEKLYSFEFDTTQFEDAACGYTLFIRLKGRNESLADSTGWFSILNSPRPISWERFKGTGSTNISLIRRRVDYEVVVTTPGLGAVRFGSASPLIGSNLDRGLEFYRGAVEFRKQEFPCWKNLPKSFEVTLYSITYNKPRILRDGEPCVRCRIISYRNSTLVFEAQDLSKFKVVEGLSSQLETSNPTGNYKGYKPGEWVEFTARYETLRGRPIYGPNVSCVAEFPDSSKPMEYNSARGLYIVKERFPSAGRFRYFVSCQDLTNPTNNNRVEGFFRIL